MTQRKPTRAAGAVIQRSLVQRKIRRMQYAHRGDDWADYRLALSQLSAWLKAEPQRAKRKGGIGR